MLSSAKQQRDITVVAALATTRGYDCKSLKFSVFNSEASARTSPVVAYFTNIEECKQGGIIAKTSQVTFSLLFLKLNGFLVSKETVVLRRWDSEIKLCFYQTS